MENPTNPDDGREGAIAVLVSGGIESAVLTAELGESAPEVFPIHLRFGLVWEPVEEAALRRFLDLVDNPRIHPLRVFELPLGPVYGEHWSTNGDNTPDGNSRDEAVFLPGRNLLLLAQPAVWCHLQGIPTIALGPLAGNPFPDSTDEFFREYQVVLNRALEGRLRIVCPFRNLQKPDVLRRGKQWPLHETFSCIRPVGTRHCRQCNKCAERRRAFSAARIPDRTDYAT